MPQGRVIGQTPAKISNYFRGNEIKWWLKDNPGKHSYIIFDDGDDFYPSQKRRLLITPFNTGITDAQVDEAIKLLNK